MDIAVITQSVNSHSGSRAPLELAKNLSKNNDISIYSYPHNSDKNLIENLEKLKIKIILLPYEGKSVINQIKNTFALSKRLNSSKHDIISAHCLPPLFMATWFSNTPTVSTYYGTQKNILTEKNFPKKLSPLNNFAQKILNLIIFVEQWIIVNTTSKTVAISQYTMQEADDAYHCKISFIYLGAISKNLKSEQN